MLIPTSKRSCQNCSTMEMHSTKMYEHVGKAYTDQRYKSWRLLLIAKKMSIHHLMFTLQHQIQRNHDHWMGFNYASTTLMKKIMILKSVSIPTQRCSIHMVTKLLKDGLKIFIWMMNSKLCQRSSNTLNKSSRVHCWKRKAHDNEESKNTSYKDIDKDLVVELQCLMS